MKFGAGGIAQEASVSLGLWHKRRIELTSDSWLFLGISFHFSSHTPNDVPASSSCSAFLHITADTHAYVRVLWSFCTPYAAIFQGSLRRAYGRLAYPRYVIYRPLSLPIDSIFILLTPSPSFFHISFTSTSALFGHPHSWAEDHRRSRARRTVTYRSRARHGTRSRRSRGGM